MSEDNAIQITEQDIDLSLEDVIVGRNFTTGKSGYGKSNTLGKLLEELLERNIPFLIVDTEGEYHGLKESYEVLHVGAGEECELQVGPEHAEKIAELVLKQDVPVILDISEYLDKEEAENLVKQTLRTMYEMEKALRKPTLAVVEEGHEFIPEKGYQKKADYPDCAGIIVRIVKRGRKRGLGIALASQRPASVDTDYITQCNWRIWHRLDWKNDLQVVKDVLEKNKPRTEFVDEEDAKKWSEIVSGLQPGEAVLEADFLDTEVQQVKFLRKDTFDFGEQPSLEDYERPELKGVSGDLVQELQQISEKKRQEENRIEQLEAELERKEDEINDLEDELDRAKDISDMAQQFTEAMASGGSREVQEKVDEIREGKNERIRELESEKDGLEEELTSVRESRQELQQRVQELEEYEQAVEHMDELREGVSRMADVLGLETGAPDEKVRRKVQQKEEQINKLEAKISKLEQQGYSLDEEFQDKMDFLKHDAVRDEISKAGQKMKTKEDHAWDVLSVLVDQNEAQIDDITPYTDVSRSSVSNILSKLHDHSVVSKRRDNKQNCYSLNVRGMKEIIQTRKKRSEMTDLKNQVRAE